MSRARQRSHKGFSMGMILPSLILVAAAVGAWFTWQHMHARTHREVPAAIQRFSAEVAGLGWAHEADVVTAFMPQPGVQVVVAMSARGDARRLSIERYQRPDQARAQLERLRRLPSGVHDRAEGVYVLMLGDAWPANDPLLAPIQARFEAWARDNPP